jgi:ribosome-associated protein
MNHSKEMAKLAIHALEDKKAENISIIDISNVSVVQIILLLQVVIIVIKYKH